MKKQLSAFAVLALNLLITTPAFAHVRIEPSTTVVGRQVYGVRIPNEKAIPTTKVRLVVPDGIEVTGIMPAAGWSHTEKKVKVEHNEAEEKAEAGGHQDEEATERISEIVWTGGKISDGEFMVFNIATNYEGSPAKITWKAYQTYSDGSVVAWDGSSEEAEAPVVEVTEKTELEALQASVADLKSNQNSDDGFKADLNTWLAGGALLIGLAAIMMQLEKRQEKATK